MEMVALYVEMVTSWQLETEMASYWEMEMDSCYLEMVMDWLLEMETVSLVALDSRVKDSNNLGS